MINTVSQAVINGLMIGGFYALIGMGLNCIFGVMKIINFCQGELMMIGMYVSLFMFQSLNLDPYLAIPLVAVVLFVLGGLIQNTLITPSLKSESTSNLLFLTVGLGMLFQNLSMLFFKSDYRSIKTSYSQRIISFADLTVSFPKLISFGFMLVLTALLFQFFKRTRMGKMIRATSQNPVGAKLVGIKVQWIYIFTYGLGAAIAGMAGALLLPFYYVFPMVGATFSTRAFIVVVIGGLGNIRGAFVAGLLLGLLETLGSLIVGPALKDSVIFLTFIVILVAQQKLKLQKAG